MAMLTSSQMLSSLIFVFLLLVCSSPAVSGSDDHQEGLIHIPLYVHETLSGRNATVTPLTASPVGANSTFGSIGVVDDEVRVGLDRSSQLVGRFKGFVVDTTSRREASAPEYVSSATVMFTTGEYNGSTLSVEGYLPGSSKGMIIERAVVGGTGKFRLARGYSLTKTLGKTSRNTDVFLFDLFVLMHSN